MDSFDELPLIKVLKEYMNEDIAPFSMPGHKYGRAFFNDGLGELMLRADITEFDGVDNLHKPEGVIKESQDMLTKLYRSKKSYFLVNGSTSGNLIMMFAAFNEGDTVIVERNCHRSIMNAIIVRKLKPIFVKNIIHKDFKAPIGIDIDDLDKIIKNNKEAKGVVLTYPYYYGIGIGMKDTIKICKENGLSVLIDSAHGAHFGFNKKLPKSAQDFGADIVVMSAHKTLPSLTQTAYIHINNEKFLDKVDFYKGVFLSTSPSYMFMMSLEYGRYFLEAKAENYYDLLLERIERFKNNIRSIDYIKLIDKKFFGEFEDVELDSSRIVLHLSEGLSGHKLLDYLREEKVQCEMSDERNVILIPSPFNCEEDFVKLENALINCDKNILKQEEKGFYDIEIPKMSIIPADVLEMDREWVDLDKAADRVVGENIIPYPPGVPLLVMGEKIEQRHISFINKYLEDKITLMGVENRKVLVVKK